MAKVTCEIEFAFKITPNSAAELEELLGKCDKMLRGLGAKDIMGSALAKEIPDDDPYWPPAGRTHLELGEE